MPQYNVTPERDTTLGLIFRLNGLWPMADQAATSGDYDKWNNVLDSLFRNLDYKPNYVAKKNEKGEIIEVIIDDDDTKIYNFFCKKVFEAKSRFNRLSKEHKDKRRGRAVWWYWVHQKDRWIRKFMQKRQLYLKEVEHIPGTAMFGSFGRKK